MSHPVTLFTGQWADMPFEELCKVAVDFVRATLFDRPATSFDAACSQAAQPTD